MNSPFETLGIAPTRDASAVKVAYFAALKKFPPHADPQGFRRLREAYEELSQPGALAWAFVRAPIDRSVVLEEYERRYGEVLRRARVEWQAEAEGAEVVARFAASYARLTIEEAVALANETTAAR